MTIEILGVNYKTVNSHSLFLTTSQIITSTMVLAERTKRREEELTERTTMAPALKRAADDIVEPRVFKMGKFESGR